MHSKTFTSTQENLKLNEMFKKKQRYQPSLNFSLLYLQSTVTKNKIMDCGRSLLPRLTLFFILTYEPSLLSTPQGWIELDKPL